MSRNSSQSSGWTAEQQAKLDTAISTYNRGAYDYERNLYLADALQARADSVRDVEVNKAIARKAQTYREQARGIKEDTIGQMRMYNSEPQEFHDLLRAAIDERDKNALDRSKGYNRALEEQAEKEAGEIKSDIQAQQRQRAQEVLENGSGGRRQDNERRGRDTNPTESGGRAPRPRPGFPRIAISFQSLEFANVSLVTEMLESMFSQSLPRGPSPSDARHRN